MLWSLVCPRLTCYLKQLAVSAGQFGANILRSMLWAGQGWNAVYVQQMQWELWYSCLHDRWCKIQASTDLQLVVIFSSAYIDLWKDVPITVLKACNNSIEELYYSSFVYHEQIKLETNINLISMREVTSESVSCHSYTA